jgi:8-oxo-dGTP pyrophosphatase MutT (NUDIX family)
MQPVPDRLRWVENSRRKVASCRIFDLYRTRQTAADGRRGDFYVLDAPDWINVVPVILGERGEDGFLMVRQYRYGAAGVTTEFPAGLVGRNEAPLSAARRELAEETGYSAGRMTLLGRMRPNPAFMNNWCYTYLAEDLSKAGGQALDALEILDVREVAVSELRRGIGTGEYVNSLVMAALLWYTFR